MQIISFPLQFKNFIKRRLVFLAWVSLFCILIGEAGRWFWILELFSHFVPFYAILLILGALASNRLWQTLLFSVTALGLFFWIFSPLWMALYPNSNKNTPLFARTTPTLQKFLTYNLFIDNPNIAHNIEWLLASDVDVIFLTEATLDSKVALKRLSHKYPYGCAALTDSPFGLALYSRHSLQNCEILYFEDLEDFPYVRAELNDQRVLYGIHPPPPISQDFAEKRNQSLNALAEKISAEKQDVIVMGDMNTTPFSVKYREFIQKTGLQPTVPLRNPTWLPGLLSLDHILLKGPHMPEKTGQTMWMGSDHRPVWVIW